MQLTNKKKVTCSSLKAGLVRCITFLSLIFVYAHTHFTKSFLWQLLNFWMRTTTKTFFGGDDDDALFGSMKTRWNKNDFSRDETQKRFFAMKHKNCFFVFDYFGSDAMAGLTESDCPAWTIRSLMLCSRSSILPAMSSIRVIIWSDMDWNLSCICCSMFWM